MRRKVLPANALRLSVGLLAATVWLPPPSAISRAGETSPAAPEAYREFEIRGEDAVNGAYDPSVEYDAAGVGWMSYSTVRIGTGVGTAVARSDDRGRTWKRVAEVNRPKAGKVQTPRQGKLTGAWWHEVSTLVHDPADRGKEWKLFWHRYFSKMPHKTAEDRVLSHGWIAMKTAANPAGPWSEETCLLGAGPFPLAPARPNVKVSDLHRDLADVIILTEPGSLCLDGVIYLSLQAHRLAEPKAPDTILIASRDHGRTWKYLGTLLRAAEAKPFDGDAFTGSSLAVEKGRVFLLVAPEQFGEPLTGHRGTVIFEFEDLDKAALKRDERGAPRAMKRLLPRLAKGGQADYDEGNTAGGIVFPQFDIRNLPRAWRLFSTGRGIAAKEPLPEASAAR